MSYTNSPLVSYTQISPNKTSPRTHVIDTITIHCVVGQLSVESLGAWFAKSSTQASCNYGIGTDGRILLCVEEKDRSWCSSSASNDHRAITIECASDKTSPYAINDAVYASLIDLLVDICERNGIDALRWKADKSLIGYPEQQNMTVHMWFKNKECPGQYIYERLGQIAEEVNTRLGVSSVEENETAIGTIPDEGIKVRISINDLNIRKGPGTNYAKTGNYTGIGVFTVVDIMAGQGSDSGWGKLKSGAGWISMDYVSIL